MHANGAPAYNDPVQHPLKVARRLVRGQACGYFRRMTVQRLAGFGAVLVLAACQTTSPLDEVREIQPSAELEPQEVVEVQLEAFRLDNGGGLGIAHAFQFASPDNRAVTGPLERFIGLMQSPAYRPMLQPASTEVRESVLLEENTAAVPVVIDDQENQRFFYVFYLRRQVSGDFEGYWMTEAVRIEGLQGGEPSGAI